MNFQNKLEGLFNKGKAKYEEYSNKHNVSQHPPPPQHYQNQYTNQYQNQYQPQFQNQAPNYQSTPAPPPINYSSKPGGSSQPPQAPAYWIADFNPSTPLTQVFIQETGAHGWGNNESQNYTNSSQNSFFTPDHKLVLRAIVNNSLPEGEKYTSARLNSIQKLDRQRGCLTATISPPSAHGVWPAFWLLPAGPFEWPTDGEVDIFESWNGDNINHSCLHWGHFNGPDHDKHRVVETLIPSLTTQPHVFAFAWDQGPDINGKGGEGKMIWYIDGQAVMRANIPGGMRPLRDYRVILNIAMGGNVCQGKLPSNGTYDFIVHEMRMSEEPNGGWGQFSQHWERAREGKAM